MKQLRIGISLLLLLLVACTSNDILTSNTTSTAPDSDTPTATNTLTPEPTNTPTPTPEGYLDGDRDGLSDEKENQVGTRPQISDTDGDGISDYDEVTKYYLNPLSVDSDGDGTPDNDFEERREYTYTIRAIMNVRSPYDIESMNDHFQDVVLISEGSNNLTFQVTFYPEAYHIIEEIPLIQVSDWHVGLDRFLAPGPVINFDGDMSVDTIELFTLGEGTTDLDAVNNMYKWERTVERMPGTSDYSSPYPEPFLDLFITEDDQIIFPDTPQMFSNVQENTNVDTIVNDIEWQMSHLILGKEMFYNRTQGSCGSIANFHSTVLRSLGIPTRIIQTIPIFARDSYYQKSLLDPILDSARTKLTNRLGYNHFLVEAYIGNQWIRINNSSYEDQVELGGAFIKVVSFASWKDVDFAHHWGQADWPYSLIEIEEKTTVHQPMVYDFSR